MTREPAFATPPASGDRIGPLERYLNNVALGRTLGLRQRLGEPTCPVLDVRAALARQGGSSAGFVAALKDFKARQAQDQQALLHEVDASLHRALQRRARHLADCSDRLGAGLLHWWAATVDRLCSDDSAQVTCAGLHLLWAHVLTSQVIDAQARPRGAAGVMKPTHALPMMQAEPIAEPF